MSNDSILPDLITELRFALAESECAYISATQRDRILAVVPSGRTPGYAVGGLGQISGPETFRRITSRFDNLLAELTVDEWLAATIRGMDVQQLVGHLIGVEEAFAAVIAGSVTAGAHGDADHVESTQAAALRQTGRPPPDTRQDWQAAVGRTLELAGDGRDLSVPARFHGISFAIEAFLVVRAFELWTHEEDIRRATGRPTHDPDGEILNRMTDVAASLLSAGVSSISNVRGRTARLVLTGPGGGTWDVALGGAVRRAQTGGHYDALIAVDAAAFCRVVADRSDMAASHATLRGDSDLASLVFAGAAALALD
jgi:uncharacterized protein (TIGR03083 family)